MSTIKVDTIKTTSNVEVFTAKAWVNFNGTGTVAIRASGNVSSITDNGTGDYTVNFTTAMPDVNYSFSGGAGLSSTDLMCVVQPRSTFVPTITACRFQVVYNANTLYDVTTCNVQVFS